jgi:hypothetical protein
VAEARGQFVKPEGNERLALGAVTRSSWKTRLSACHSELCTVWIHELLLLFVTASVHNPINSITNQKFVFDHLCT